MALEAHAPRCRPVIELALAREIPGDEFLLVTDFAADPLVMPAELGQRVGVGAGLESVDRGVAGLVALVPFLDDEEFAGLLDSRAAQLESAS